MKTSPVEADPARSAFDRGLALRQQMPVGELGKTLTAAQVSAESRSALARYEEGDYLAVFTRRCELGMGVPDGLESSDLFWLNAVSGLSGLRLGFKEHGVVPMCCGRAEQDADRSDPRQSAMVDEINERFFG